MSSVNRSKIAFSMKISFDIAMSIAIMIFALWAFEFSMWKVPIAITIGLISATCIWFSKKLEIYGILCHE